VYFYQTFHAGCSRLARARIPYNLDKRLQRKFEFKYNGLDKSQAMELLQENFARKNTRIPVLFKQYAALFENDGFQALECSVDPSFGDCVDVLCMADLNRLKATKRKRYIPFQDTSQQLVNCA
jgi:hypothetical protein